MSQVKKWFIDPETRRALLGCFRLTGSSAQLSHFRISDQHGQPATTDLIACDVRELFDAAEEALAHLKAESQVTP